MSNTQHPLDGPALSALLSIRDLTDPGNGPHAIQELLHRIVDALADNWGCEVRWIRRSPVVSVEDNYDRLRIPSESVSRDSRYTRYLAHDVVLRTHSTAHIPEALRELARVPADDVLLVCAGMVYRRDSIDRIHTGTPHQVDLWRIRRGNALTERDLDTMTRVVIEQAAPGRLNRLLAAEHPYTTHGRQVEVAAGDDWVEICEGGVAHPDVLSAAGLVDHSGLAMGLGLDRLVMLRKGVPDIRLLRSDDERVRCQMVDLRPYRAVSSHPPIRRDISIAVSADEDAETLGDRIRSILGPDADWVEAVEVVSTTPVGDLPKAARNRLGIRVGQVNALIRVTLRHATRTLTDAEANELRDRIAEAVHEGSGHPWLSGSV
jgi:phenylalanyl-tRNA synthetase alpha chain